MEQIVLIGNIFNAFQQLKNFQVDEKVKKRMLKELLEAGPNPWRVVGITPNALSLFKENEFKKVKNIKIQRAHLNNRDEWYGDLFKNDWKDSITWYDFIHQRDQTVLALSSENIKIKDISYIEFKDKPINLFRSKLITWTHKQDEINYLRDIYNSYVPAPNSAQDQ